MVVLFRVLLVARDQAMTREFFAVLRWERYPLVAGEQQARRWIQSCVVLGLAQNTITAYLYALEDYLGFCQRDAVNALAASREAIVRYLGDLRSRSPRGANNVVQIDSGAGLSNATLQQRLTAVRLFYEFLVEDERIRTNPVPRGRHSQFHRSGGHGKRGLIQRFHKLPWIPSEEQWAALLTVVREERLRTRCMLAFAYDAALRREELCQLRSDDLDPAHRTLRIRSETTKGRRERVLPYSPACGALLGQYLRHRQTLSSQRGPLFLSESPRNYAAPITLWTWSKVIRSIALRAGVPRFSTHSLRHLCLTDLARAGWSLHEIARIAGHRNLETTQRYLHLSARDIIDRYQGTMLQLHDWRVEALSAASVHPGH
jgi:site-specific recombinase XerD